MSEHGDVLVQVAELVAPTGWRKQEPVSISYQNQRFPSGQHWRRVVVEIGDAGASDHPYRIILSVDQTWDWVSALTRAAWAAEAEVPELGFKEMGAGI